MVHPQGMMEAERQWLNHIYLWVSFVMKIIQVTTKSK